MPVETKTIKISTSGDSDMIDLTPMISEKLEGSKIKDGIVTVFAAGSTAGITTIEYEPGLLKDFPEIMDRIAPKDEDYEHHKTWDDRNGSSHVKSSIIGTSFTAPFRERKLMTGTWQQIVFVDFDTGPRDREIILQIMGE